MEWSDDERTKLLDNGYGKPSIKREEETIRESPSVSYLQLYKHSTKLDKIYLFLGIIFSLIPAVCVTVFSYTMGEVADAMVKYVTATLHETDNAETVTMFKDAITKFAAVNLLLAFFSTLGTYAAIVLFSYSALNQTTKIRGLLLKSILNQDIGWYDLNQTGDFASRVADDLKKVQEGIGEKVPMTITHSVICFSCILQALIFGWELALVCMASLPICVIAIGLMYWSTSKFTMQEVGVYGAAGAIAEEALRGVKTVVAYGGEKKETERYDKLLKFACDNNIKRSLYNGICVGATWFSTYACYALGFWFGVKEILFNSEKYNVGIMVTVFFSISTSTWFITLVLPYLEIFGMAKGAAVRIFEIIASEPVINASKKNGLVYKKIEGRISFKNVYFSYPSRPGVKVLKGFNLTVNPGETVALVGSSGCGKSTCVQLIQRFYDPEFGSILIDNYNLTELDLTWIRSHIGVVGQEPVLFNTTIAENIRLGCQNANAEDIEDAAKKANAHDFIQMFPQKYETLVDQRGMQLSGGQKQRIAIARALVRKPSILLLDEATSALDTNSEAVVQAALDAARTQCTTIIVAHRLSTIKQADRIVVLSKGRVQEEGSHQDLMQKKGVYFGLVMAQVPQEDDKEKASPASDKLEVLKEETIQTQELKQDLHIQKAFQKIEKCNMYSIWPIMKHNLPEWWAIVFGCISSVINAAGVPVYAIIFGKIMGVLALDDADYIQDQATKYAVMFLIIAVVLGLASFFQTYMFGLAGEKLTMRLRSKMFQAYLSQDMSYFDNTAHSVGTLCANLSKEAASVQGATGQRIGTILTSLSTVIFALSSSFYFEWHVTLVSLCIAPFIVAVGYWETKLNEQDDEAHYKTLQNSTKVAVEAINEIRTVASLGCEKKFYELYLQEIGLYQQKFNRNSHYHGIIFGLSHGLLFFAYAIIILYSSNLIVSKHIDYYRVLIVSESIVLGSWSLKQALSFTSNFQKGITAAKRITTVLNSVPLVRHGSEDSHQTWKHPNVEYKNVHFAYPSRPGSLILKDFNMKVFQGKMIALVGPSGCGKSTVVQLLERFYDTTSGTISVDDIPIQEMHLSALRSQLGVVSQEPVLFSLSIADNIAYGDNNRVVPRTEIIKAGRKANIHDFITSLPLGYDTKLGEKGTQLSGGQKQRIAIARALIRNPKILLLDEATSALDSESEKIVQEALDNAKKGRTCIIIAHRLNTIQDADLICVISQGQIAEMGSHSELFNLRGLYYSFYNSKC